MSYVYTLSINGENIKSPIISQIYYYPAPQLCVIMGHINFIDSDYKDVTKIMDWATKCVKYGQKDYADIEINVQLAGQAIRKYEIPQTSAVSYTEFFTDKDGFGHFELVVQSRENISLYQYYSEIKNGQLKHIIYNIDDFSKYAIDDAVEYAQRGYNRSHDINVFFNIHQWEVNTVSGEFNVNQDTTPTVRLLGDRHRIIYNRIGQLIMNSSYAKHDKAIVRNKDVGLRTQDFYRVSSTDNRYKISGEGISISYTTQVRHQYTGLFVENLPQQIEKAVEEAEEIKDNISKTPQKVKMGDQFKREKRKKVLKPNIEYTTPEGYKYKTDDLGRIISCEGTLVVGKAKRKAHAQKSVGGDDRRDDDDGGHLIATIFKGSGDYDNLVPMNGNLNKGEWKKLENMWAKNLNKKPPKTVQVKITPIYEGNSQRPKGFNLKYKIGNRGWEKVDFENEAGGK